MTEEEENKKRFPVWAIILLVVVLILLLGLAYFVVPKYVQYRQTKKVVDMFKPNHQNYKNLTQQKKKKKIFKKTGGTQADLYAQRKKFI